MEYFEIVSSFISNRITFFSNQNNANDPATILLEYLKCPHHRDMVIDLSSIIQVFYLFFLEKIICKTKEYQYLLFCNCQVVTLECPTALVWNNVGENKSFSLLNGSPLDFLPCTPASLPTPQRCATMQIR